MAASTNSKINYYLSVNGTLDASDFKFYSSTSIPVIQPGSFKREFDVTISLIISMLRVYAFAMESGRL